MTRLGTCLTLAVIAFGCAPGILDGPTGLEATDDDLRALEGRLGSDPQACVDYLDLCEQAMSICIQITSTPEIKALCDGITNRCKANIATYCSDGDDAGAPGPDGAPPLADGAAQPPDPDAGPPPPPQPDSAPPSPDAGTPSAPDSAVPPPPPPPPPPTGSGIWISPQELAQRPTSGAAWQALLSKAGGSCGTPDLSDQDDATNVCILAKALVHARTGQVSYRNDVLAALSSIASSGSYSGRALALGRELGTYVVAADLISLETVDPTLDGKFRAKIKQLLTTPTSSGPSSLVECHEKRPNNWGTHCGASRAAVAAYLGDKTELDKTAKVFLGWLGDRATYAGFSYGDLSWQCDPAKPVGINPKGCTKSGHDIDGVLPDDQRRAGSFTWPPPKENYVYEAMQGGMMQAVILHRAGYPVFAAQDQALYRAYVWLHQQASFPAEGDDTWSPHLINHFYGASFPAPVPSKPGKNMGYTDWTHGS
jgi:hypothetical protein